MDVFDAKTAREFVSAWTGRPGAGFFIGEAARSQRWIAGSCRLDGQRVSAARHEAAAVVLEGALAAVQS